jgi:hypothetical protein
VGSHNEEDAMRAKVRAVNTTPTQEDPTMATKVSPLATEKSESQTDLDRDQRLAFKLRLVHQGMLGLAHAAQDPTGIPSDYADNVYAVEQVIEEVIAELEG